MARASPAYSVAEAMCIPAPFQAVRRPWTPGRSSALLSAILLASAAAACGGESKPTTTTRSTATTRTTTAPKATAPASSVSTGPVHGRLTAENHAPVVNKAWRYSVTVTDASGHRLSGTVDIEFVYGDVVVGHDNPPTHQLTNGHWHDTLEFPAASVGQPLSFRAVVHTSVGSITLDWPIRVRR